MGWLGNPAFRDADDIGARWLKDRWRQERASGATTLSFRAWCRDQGFFTGGNPSGWDDLRRVSMVPLSSVNLFVGDGGAPGGEREPEMTRLESLAGIRRRPSRRRRRRQLPPSLRLDKDGRKA